MVFDPRQKCNFCVNFWGDPPSYYIIKGVGMVQLSVVEQAM